MTLPYEGVYEYLRKIRANQNHPGGLSNHERNIIQQTSQVIGQDFLYAPEKTVMQSVHDHETLLGQTLFASKPIPTVHPLSPINQFDSANQGKCYPSDSMQLYPSYRSEVPLSYIRNNSIVQTPSLKQTSSSQEKERSTPVSYSRPNIFVIFAWIILLVNLVAAMLKG